MGLDIVELVMTWEEHFDVRIPNELAATLETPRKAIAAIEELLRNKPNANRAWTSPQIEKDICDIVVKQLGIKRQDFTLDSYFVRDMGVD